MKAAFDDDLWSVRMTGVLLSRLAQRALSTTQALLASLAIVHAGCGGLPNAPAYPTQEDIFSRPQKVVRAGLGEDKPPPLVIRPGDTLAIDILSTEQTTIPELLVDAEGKVYLPLAGDIEVGGLRLAEAQQRVQEAQRTFDSLATVTLRMTARGGHRVAVLGAVAQQGIIPLSPAARVTDVLAEVGGPITQPTITGPIVMGDISSAVLMRDGKAVPIDVAEALRGDLKHNVYVHAGDHIYVPPVLDSNISVLGQVGGPQVFPFRSGLRLSGALAQAGGINVGGDKTDVRVIRGTLTEPRVYRASLRALVDGDAHDVMLQPGDIIFVTDHFIEDFGEVFSLISPALSLGVTAAALTLSIQRQ